MSAKNERKAIENEASANSDSDDSNEELDGEKCQKLVEQFVEMTNTDEALAQFFLQERRWDLNHSLNDYFASISKHSKSREIATVTLSDHSDDDVVELQPIGGLPSGILDVWEATGKRKECQYTWDMMRNDNLDWRGGPKGAPRCRFDRIFFRPSNPIKLTCDYFGLIGIERLKPHVCFPSDHWGLLAHFKK
ncbi:tyrosyl-DNA phosphodiesterase 2-like protein [Dinothrombium tinctorium]|uniref:Tyrosyl-DNA phosphodiesterase 2-like protein n=1 Tax=Dinothrombium tinctorium TaxID=1965070 RepID=A0A3S3PJL9_9ACAR|nr:tyrosyl-DNA phosphodiesterase 2-like protein [Dinothrombium tinctorium]RWS03268.1 tyrosyl-DNA phosphodiesterase 2-like protein [Dinothrombium tinctorium]RWS03409.1 tyrosyl-DNA phosphodiesterase 2-like protein [Dinothrombium tinctorium]